MNLLEVAGHLIVRRAVIERGKGINMTEIIGNLTIQNAELEQQYVGLQEVVKRMSADRDAKLAELAGLRGQDAPPKGEPIKDEEECLDQLKAHASSLAEALKGLDAQIKAAKGQTTPPAAVSNPAAEPGGGCGTLTEPQ